MSGCCDVGMKQLCEELNCKIEETEGGIRVDLRPKDPAKVESLRGMIQGCKDFLGCKC